MKKKEILEAIKSHQEYLSVRRRALQASYTSMYALAAAAGSFSDNLFKARKDGEEELPLEELHLLLQQGESVLGQANAFKAVLQDLRDKQAASHSASQLTCSPSPKSVETTRQPQQESK